MSARAFVCLLALAAGGCGLQGASTAADQPSEGSCHARGHGLFVLPDPRCTPGATDPRVTQADIRSTICRRGYTRRVRPRASVTEPEKLASMAAYDYYAGRRPSRYEYDHLIPLELGGAPNDPRNLWPERGATPNPKDRLERRLNREVCGGQLSLRAAQREVALDWITATTRSR